MINFKFTSMKVDDLINYSDVINQPNNQEVVLLHVKEMKYEWRDYADFDEERVPVGRTIVIPLPTADFNCLAQLKELCDTLVNASIGPNRDYEYVIRWTPTTAVFHVLFSDHMINYARTPKIYTRDFWYDKKTNRQAKPNAKNAELRFEEGTFQRDKDGKIKFEEPPFTDKDDFFLTEEWAIKFNQDIDRLFTEFLATKEQSLALIGDQRELAVTEKEPEKENVIEKSLSRLRLHQPEVASEQPKEPQQNQPKKKLNLNFSKQIEKLELSKKAGPVFSKIGGFLKKIGQRIGFVFKVVGSAIKNFFTKTGILKKLSDFIN